MTHADRDHSEPPRETDAGGMDNQGAELERLRARVAELEHALAYPDLAYALSKPTDEAPDSALADVPRCPTCGRWRSGGGLCLDDFHAYSDEAQ